MPSGGGAWVPEKLTSFISPPRRALADCSPSIQRMASRTLLLPQPLGPTMAVTPGWNSRVVRSANDLNPTTLSDFKYMALLYARLLTPDKEIPPLVVVYRGQIALSVDFQGVR